MEESTQEIQIPIKLLLFIAKQGGLEMSTKVLIEELEDINLVTVVYPDRKVTQKVSHMSSVQKKLFDLFGFDKYT